MNRTVVLGPALLVALSACGNSDARIERESLAFKALLPDIARRYERWVAAGQADSIASLFDEVGQQLPPNEPTVVGRTAIRDRQARLASWGTWQLRLTPRSAMAYGRSAVDDGAFAISFTPGPNAPPGMLAVADSGKYLAHWFLEGDGQWRILQLVWNSDLPLPSPPTSSTRR
jgi:hypothetical protein